MTSLLYYILYNLTIVDIDFRVLRMKYTKLEERSLQI